MRPTAPPRDGEPGLADRLFAWPQYLLPQHLLSRLLGAVARCGWRPLKDPLIRAFARRYDVDLDEARFRSAGAYPDFRSFFTRELRPGARPVAAGPGAVASPVDGRVFQVGTAGPSEPLRAKGGRFDLVRLLGGSAAAAEPFLGGSFATLYLSPRDYHRIHLPLAGTLREMTLVPGRLFSVNARTARVVPDLFARNERVVTRFDTEVGPLALVMVGALVVGSVETPWHGVVTPPRGSRVATWSYPEGQVVLARGQEVGRFHVGSTVIVLFGPDRVRWAEGLVPGAPVRMGQAIGRV